jgi:hypothetical protein
MFAQSGEREVNRDRHQRHRRAVRASVVAKLLLDDYASLSATIGSTLVAR